MAIRKRKSGKLHKQGKLKSIVLKYFLKNPKKRMNAASLSKKLKVGNNKDSINTALKSLLKEGKLRSVSENKYVLDKKGIKDQKIKTSKAKYTGTVEIIRSGAAYIIVDNLEKDVYVPERDLNTAVNGDEVELDVRFFKSKNPEGRITKILKRNITQVIGKLITVGKDALVQSRSRKSSLDVFVKQKHFNGAKEGDLVMIDVYQWGDGSHSKIYGEVSRIISDLGHHDVTMESILVENGFNASYPKLVLKELDAFTDEISEEEIQKRRDFRDVLTFTIDPDTAQDFDDAISFKELDNGDVEIGVHIADVTHFVRPKTHLDKEAFERSTSVYLVDRCIAMLPEKLSNNLCSLNPHVDRLAFSAVFTFDKNYKLVSEWFGKAIIHSDKRFTYEEAQSSIENKKGELHKELTIINKVAKKLRKEKFKNGAIAFESDEIKFILDEDKKPTGVFVKERKDSHLLIEDFMLLANKRVARYIATKDKSNKIPFVYRVHDMPDLDRLMDLGLFMYDFDVKLDLSTPANIAKSFNKLSAKAKEDDKYKLLMQLAIRTMAKAEYSTDNIGHYGLRFDYYTHFTSPIRRYSDVLVHRILEQNLNQDHREDKNKLEAKCIHISKQERRAMEAERESIKYKKVEYIAEHVGEEFDGIVSGMIDKGVFVELSDSKAEGMIPFDKFNDSFTLSSGRYKATSLRTNKVIKMGDPIRVKVISADLENKQIELQPILK